MKVETRPGSLLQRISAELIREPERSATAGHYIPRPGVLWHLLSLAAQRTTDLVDLPQSESAFLAHKLKSEVSTISALKTVTLFQAADVSFFSATGTD
jgi:hypothetical protein